MFLFREMDKNTEEYGPLKVSIRRYQKRNGVFRQQSKFNISNAKQGKLVAQALLNWFPIEEGDPAPVAAPKKAKKAEAAPAVE